MVRKIETDSSSVVTVEQTGNSKAWDSVSNIYQIGPKYTSLLKEDGIETVGALLVKDPDEVASVLSISVEFARTLHSNAEEYISDE